MALDCGFSLHDPIRIRLAGKNFPPELLPEGFGHSDGRTPVPIDHDGRAGDLQRRPSRRVRVPQPLALKGDIGRIVDECVHRFDRAMVEETLDNLKNLGFHYATRAGVTIGVEDVTVPPAKQAILDEHEKRAQKVEASTARASSPTTSGARS